MLGACNSVARGPATMPAAAGTLSELSPSDLRDLLADFGNAHHDKVQLAWWASTPLRPVDATFKPFFSEMGQRNKELLAELEAYAKARGFDLTYRYSNDLYGKAQKLMEDRQEKQIRGDDRSEFQRDILMQMYTDYEWRISQLKTFLPLVHDGALKAYVEKSLAMYEAGDREIVALLKHYKYSQ